MSYVPSTSIRTSHALTIKVNGVAIGLINGWNPAQGRGATLIFEVDSDGSGNPVEIMPGNVTGNTIQVSRFDTYTARMEQAFGTSDLVMLTRQNMSFDVTEEWIIPVPASNWVPLPTATPEVAKAVSAPPAGNEGKERFMYMGCWFTNLGRIVRADDNRIVNVNATLMYTKKVKMNGWLSGALDWNGIGVL